MITPGGWGLFAGWLLKSSAQAALLVVLVLAVQWMLRRWLTPRWRYFLWWLVVARLLMPVSLPGPVSIFNWVKWNSPPAPAMAVMPITPDVALPAPPPDTIATAIEETTPALPAQSPVTIAAPAPTAPTRPPFDWRLGVMWLWLVGAALLGARLVWSVLHMRRELKTATPVDDPTVLALLDECRERMRVRDRLTLLETPLVNSPALCGFWRPRLLLPPGLCRDFTAQQLRFIFLHELAHVRRHDIAVNWLITLLQLLHWFNPLVWLAFSRLRADRELACDALALSVAAPGEQHAYGQTIIRLLEGFARPSAMPGLVGILEDKSQMKRRIRMIAQFRRPGRWAWLSGIAAAILGIACLTDAQTPKGKGEAKPFVVTIKRDSPHLHLNDSPVKMEDLQKELVAQRKLNAHLKVELKAEREAPFRIITEVIDAVKLAEVESVSLNSVKTDMPKPSEEKPNKANATTNGNVEEEIATRRGEMFERVERLRLPRVEFNSVPLPQVIQELSRLAREHDPEHLGVNFRLSALFHIEQAPSINPQTGLPEEPTNEVLVSLAELKDVTLRQALDAVVKGASQPICFQVESYAVVCTTVPVSEQLALFTRWYKVDPNTFARTLDELIVVGATNQSRPDSRLATSRFTNAPSISGNRMRWFFASLGVDLNPPKNCYFTLGKGMLMVRATQQDHDAIEVAIQVLNTAVPQVSIEVKYAEVSSDDSDGAAFLDLIGFNSTATNALSDTAKPMTSSEVKTAIERAVMAARIGNTNGDPVAAKVAKPVFTSVLKADQFRAVVRALEKRKGVDLLSMPRVTTLSGRQAQSKTVEIRYVVTDIDHSPSPDRKPQPIAEPFELGPSLDVIPDVSADLRTIRLTMIPTIKEFLGYDQEAGKQLQKSTGATWIVPLPKFRLRQVMATANVADGQTVVLSPGAIEVEAKAGDRKGKATRKHLFIFVTPTLIDPAGNPVHGGNPRP